MKSVTIETALLADAVIKAARVAPNKGAAFDKAQGIVIDVNPDMAQAVRIMATDLDVSYFHRMSTIAVGDEPVAWRTPSGIISGWLAGLPMSAGNETVITEDGGSLVLKAGRSRMKFRLLPADDFPKIKPFNPAGLEEVKMFARRMTQVAWAVARDTPPLTGVNITGKHLIGCDRLKVALVPCTVPVSKPVTAPLGALTGVLRNVEDVKLAATDTRILMMPDDDTQLTARVYQEKYPDMMAVLPKVADALFTAEVPRTEFTDALGRMLVLVKGERYPKIKLGVQSTHVDLHMELKGVGETTERVDIAGGPADLFEMYFDPNNLLNVMGNGGRTTLKCDFTKPLAAVHFHDESGFDAYLAAVRGDDE